MPMITRSKAKLIAQKQTPQTLSWKQLSMQIINQGKFKRIAFTPYQKKRNFVYLTEKELSNGMKVKYYTYFKEEKPTKI